jgi:hypothetical protein
LARKCEPVTEAVPRLPYGQLAGPHNVPAGAGLPGREHMALGTYRIDRQSHALELLTVTETSSKQPRRTYQSLKPPLFQ